jgi:uncharacterized protein YukE
MITDIKQNEILDAFEKLIPYFKIFMEDEAIYGLNNTEYCLLLDNDTSIPMNAKTGDKIVPGSGTYKSIHEKIVINTVVPKDAFGVKVKSIAIPVKDEKGEVVGNIAIAKSMQKQEEIFEASKKLSLALGHISSALDHISTGIQEAGRTSENILTNIKGTNEKTKDTDEVLEFIRNVANKTNLLGLNAAIEASRAGDLGKGFGVVATEIRKLSSSSSDSIKKIEGVIKDIQQSVSSITGNIEDVNEVFQEQAAALEEITASIHELNETSQLLEEMAEGF